MKSGSIKVLNRFLIVLCLAASVAACDLSNDQSPVAPTPPPTEAPPEVEVVVGDFGQVGIDTPSTLTCSRNREGSCDWRAEEVPGRGWSIFAQKIFNTSTHIDSVHLEVMNEDGLLCTPGPRNHCGHGTSWRYETWLGSDEWTWVTASRAVSSISIRATGYTQSGQRVTETIPVQVD